MVNDARVNIVKPRIHIAGYSRNAVRLPPPTNVPYLYVNMWHICKYAYSWRLKTHYYFSELIFLRTNTCIKRIPLHAKKKMQMFRTCPLRQMGTHTVSPKQVNIPKQFKLPVPVSFSFSQNMCQLCFTVVNWWRIRPTRKSRDIIRATGRWPSLKFALMAWDP